MTGRTRFNIQPQSTPQGVLPPVSLGAVTTPLHNVQQSQAAPNANVQWTQQDGNVLTGQADNSPFIPPCAKLRNKRTGEIYMYDERLAVFPDILEPYDGDLDPWSTADEATLVTEMERLQLLLDQTRAQQQGKPVQAPAAPSPVAPPFPNDLPVMAIGE